MDDMVKVLLLDAHEDNGETPWATPLGGDRYRLENQPVLHPYAHGEEVIAPMDPETGWRTVRPT